jgi:hypothetical protein
VRPGVGHGPKPTMGQIGPRDLLFFFDFFLVFFFLFSVFIFGKKKLQFKSNHFQKFSKNQCNDLTLQENYFTELEQDFQKVS